jgi:hypothetical protein
VGIRGIKESYKKHERGDMEGSCVGFKGDISLWQVQLGTGFSNGRGLLVTSFCFKNVFETFSNTNLTTSSKSILL